MVFKGKRIPIANEDMGRDLIGKIRDLTGDDIANKVKLVNEISFNVPVYDFGTDENRIAFYARESSDWYLEFPEEVTITYFGRGFPFYIFERRKVND